MNALFREADMNRDGKIVYEEFVDALALDMPLLRAISLNIPTAEDAA